MGRFDDLISYLPSKTDGHSKNYKRAMERGTMAAGRGDWAAAESSYREAFECADKDDDQAMAVVKIGYALKGQRKFDEARSCFFRVENWEGVGEQALMEALYLAAHSYLDEGRRDEAPKAWAKLLRFDGFFGWGRSEALDIVAEDLLRQGKTSEALPLFIECGAVRDGAPWCVTHALKASAEIYLEQEKPAEAMVQLKAISRVKGASRKARDEARELINAIRKRL